MKNLFLKLQSHLLILIIFSFTFISNICFAQNVWSGGTPGQEEGWSIASNWSQYEVPGAFDNVIIPNTETRGNFYPVVNETVEEISFLEVDSGARLIIEPEGNLTIDGSSTYNYGVHNMGEIILEGKMNVVNTALIPIKDEGLIKVKVEELLLAKAKEQIRSDSFLLCLNLVRNFEWNKASKALKEYTMNYTEPQSDYNQALYSLGKSQINTENYLSALKTFDQILNTDLAADKKQEIEFYKALIVLSTDAELGEKYMTRIADDYAHNFQSSAEGIMSLK